MFLELYCRILNFRILKNTLITQNTFSPLFVWLCVKLFKDMQQFQYGFVLKIICRNSMLKTKVLVMPASRFNLFPLCDCESVVACEFEDTNLFLMLFLQKTCGNSSE